MEITKEKLAELCIWSYKHGWSHAISMLNKAGQSIKEDEMRKDLEKKFEGMDKK